VSPTVLLLGGWWAVSLLLLARCAAFLLVFCAVPVAALPLFSRIAVGACVVVFSLPFLPHAAELPSLGELLIAGSNASTLPLPVAGYPFGLPHLLLQGGVGAMFGLEAGAILFGGSLFASWTVRCLSGWGIDSETSQGRTGGFASLIPAVMLLFLFNLLTFTPQMLSFFGESFFSVPLTMTAGVPMGVEHILHELLTSVFHFAWSFAAVFGLPLFAAIFLVTLAGLLMRRILHVSAGHSLLTAAGVPLLLLLLAAELFRISLQSSDGLNHQLTTDRVSQLTSVITATGKP
jgi:hypothetical protein